MFALQLASPNPLGLNRTRAGLVMGEAEPWDLEPQAPYFWAQLADAALARGREEDAMDHIRFAYLAADRMEKRRSDGT